MLETFIRNTTKYLFIGTSGYDDDVLGFISERVPEGAHAHYVGSADIEEAKSRIEAAIPTFRRQPILPVIERRGFSEFLQSSEVDRFLGIP